MAGSRYAQVNDLRDFSRRAGSLDKEIRKALTKQARTVLKPTVKDVKAAVKRTPSKGKRKKGMKTTSGLRAEIARNVKTKVQASGKGFRSDVFVASAKMGGKRQNLPLLMEGGGRGRWRFPVFPKSKDAATWTWRSQRPRPFFYPTIAKHEDKMLDDMHQSVEAAVLAHLRMKG